MSRSHRHDPLLTMLELGIHFYTACQLKKMRANTPLKSNIRQLAKAGIDINEHLVARTQINLFKLV